MVSQILSHTPLWVWALLAVLISRGVAALKERPFRVAAVLLFPLVMVAGGIFGMVNRYGADRAVLACWAAGFLSVAAIGYLSVPEGAVFGTRAKPRQVGSAVPLVMILSIFVVKYALEIAFAMRPDIIGEAPASLAVALLLGGLAGLMAGRVAKFVANAHALPQPALDHGAVQRAPQFEAGIAAG
jgi:hypothetical protein